MLRLCTQSVLLWSMNSIFVFILCDRLVFLPSSDFACSILPGLGCLKGTQ